MLRFLESGNVSLDYIKSQRRKLEDKIAKIDQAITAGQNKYPYRAGRQKYRADMEKLYSVEHLKLQLQVITEFLENHGA